MMKRLFVFFILACLQTSLHAHPLGIEFWEMIEQSKLIVIGNSVEPVDNKDVYIASTYEINIISVIKGKQISGKYKVKRAQGSPFIKPNTTFIAFINHENEFEWYGVPIDTNTKQLTDQTILSLAGFYDFNAYLVSPNNITLGQLKQYLEKKQYTSTVTGNLYCFSNTSKKMEPTPVRFDISYTYTKNGITSDTKVSGITWKDFASDPQIVLSAWDNEIDLKYETNGYRAFTLTGEFLPNTDSTGSIMARFWVTDPQELNLDELKEYLQNNIHGFPYYELEVVTENNETYPLKLGEEMGRIGVLDYQGKKLGISSYNMDPYWPREIVVEYDYYYKLVISLDTTVVTKEQLEFTHEKMIRELKVNPIPGKIWMRDQKDHDKFITNCTLRYVATRFTQNVNYGKN